MGLNSLVSDGAELSSSPLQEGEADANDLECCCCVAADLLMVDVARLAAPLHASRRNDDIVAIVS